MSRLYKWNTINPSTTSSDDAIKAMIVYLFKKTGAKLQQKVTGKYGSHMEICYRVVEGKQNEES